MRRLVLGAVWTLLAVAGLASWGVATGAFTDVRPPALEQLPAELGPLSRVEVLEVEPGLLGDLPPELFTFQVYADAAGVEGFFYVAWYEVSRRWSGRPHNLPTCYRALGFAQESARPLMTPAGAAVWSRVFVRGEERIHVVHWLQEPGLTPGQDSALRRFGGLQELRPDTCSVYFEFPLADDAEPQPEPLLEAADAAIAALADGWS